MGECITIHIGQAGIQMGNAAWELLCLEHGVKQDGSVCTRGSESRCSLFGGPGSSADTRPTGSTTRVSDRHDDRVKTARRKELSQKGTRSRSASSKAMGVMHKQPHVDTHPEMFFEEINKGKLSPRALFVDTDFTTIHELSDRCRMLQPSRLICSQYDAGGLFSKGYLSNEGLVQEACNEITNMAAKCDNLGSFIVFHSSGGGTGSGLASALMLRLADQYGGKKNIVEITTMPTRKNDLLLRPSVTEPYNAVLSTHTSMHASECAFPFDNNTIYGLCRSKLLVDSPTYLNINRLIGQVVSSLTSSSRYHNEHSFHIEDLQKHLVPFPRLKFLLASLAPLGVKCTTERDCVFNVAHLTKEAMHAANHLMRLDPHHGNYIKCSLLYRGDVPLAEATDAIEQVKQLGRFNEHCEPDFAFGITSQPAPLVPFGDISSCPRSIILVSNTTSVKDSWMSVLKDFDWMFKHRAYVHWYRKDGVEADDFLEAREDIAKLVQEYKDVDITVADIIASMSQSEGTSD